MTLIGIITDSDLSSDKYFVNQTYVNAVSAAKGIPLLIPYFTKEQEIRSLFKFLKGIILTGGGDPDPVYFKDEPQVNLGQINPKRDYFEILLAKRCLQQKIPILGICRGSQVLNIAAGGTIYQDISRISWLKHQQEAPRWHPTHHILIMKHTKVWKIFGKDKIIRVNSFHHQAIAKVAPNFMVSAVAQDKIVEAVEAVDTYAIGVQWHPEELISSHGISLFISLVQAAQKAKK